MRNVIRCLLGTIILAARLVAQQDQIKLQAWPSIPLIEIRDERKLLNFDVVVTNAGKHSLRLSEIEMAVFDDSGKFVMRKTVNSDGLSPGVNVVAKPLILPGETMDVFNPFYSMDANTPIAKAEFVFRYLHEDNAEEQEKNRHRLPMDFDVAAKISISPQKYETKTNLTLPLRGRAFVWEGHDFFAHHRRIPLHDAKAAKIGMHANPNRYASDLVITDEVGNMYQGDPFNKKNWFSYGATIYAPGDGTVVGRENQYPDNEFDGKKIRSPQAPGGADEDLGNYVIIDHGDGEFSVMPHMMAGSVTVKRGDWVRQGQVIGKVGFSGDAIFPHVHYSLVSCGDIYRCEGLPAYFHHVRRLLGSKTVNEDHVTLDTGDVIESTAAFPN